MQKTAYEMRISDWSSDVCSSDLRPAAVDGALANTLALAAAGCAGACRPQRWRFLPITSRRTVHGHPPGIAMELPRHASRPAPQGAAGTFRSEEHTSELQSLMRSSYAVFCLKKKQQTEHNN